MVGGFHGMSLLSANIQDLLSDEKTPHKRRFGAPFKGPVIPFGAMVEYHPTSGKDLSRLHQFGSKMLPGKFLGHALHAVGMWKGDILVFDIEELEKMDASEIHAKRLNAKEVLTSTSCEKFIFLIADGTVKLCGGDQVLRTSTLIRDRPDRGEEQGNLRGESDGSSSTPLQDSSGNYIYRHHVEPRVKLYVPREASFTISLKCIAVTRATSTSLDVMMAENIDHYWNVDRDRDLSDSWTGFTRFTVLDGYTRSGGRLTRKQTTSRHFVAKDLERYVGSVETQRKGKVGEKPRLHNAR